MANEFDSLAKAYGREQVIDRKDLKRFAKKADLPGLVNFVGHIGLLALFGWLVTLSWATIWVIPSFLAYSIIMAFLFAPVHECSHGTPFRTRWLNETIYWVVCLIYMVPPTFFRYAHATHHTYTQIRGKDPDMLPQDMNYMKYVIYVLGYQFWWRNLCWFFMHPFGFIAPKQRYYLPQSEIPRAVKEARIIMLTYGFVLAASIFFQSWFALFYWVLPRLVGEPFMRWVRVAEHGECEESGDLSKNTRTTLTSKPIYFLFWNMPYHAEHHIAPMVPFFRLPEMHQTVKNKLRPTGESYPKVHGEVIKAISQPPDLPNNEVIN